MATMTTERTTLTIIDNYRAELAVLLTDDGIFEAMAHMTRYDGWAITTAYDTQRGTDMWDTSPEEEAAGRCSLLETLFWLKRSRDGQIIDVYLHR